MLATPEEKSFCKMLHCQGCFIRLIWLLWVHHGVKQKVLRHVTQFLNFFELCVYATSLLLL